MGKYLQTTYSFTIWHIKNSQNPTVIKTKTLVRKYSKDKERPFVEEGIDRVNKDKKRFSFTTKNCRVRGCQEAVLPPPD